MSTYVRALGWSWHRYLTFTRAGQVLTRCGRRISPDTHALDWSDDLPVNERSCERCLQLNAHDEAPNVDNDPVPA